MKKSIGFLSLGLLFAACTHDSETIPFDASAYAVDFGPGDNRVLLHRVMLVRSDSGKPDSSWWINGIQKVAFEKDTLFHGTRALVFSITNWETFADSIQTFRNRRLLVQEGDSLFEYEFKGGYVPGLVGLMKGSALDTAVFSDRVLQSVFPLGIGTRWFVRPDGNPWGHASLEKEYVGKTICGFYDQVYECGIFTTHTMEGQPLQILVSRVGVMSASIYFEAIHVPRDSLNPPHTIRRYENYDLHKINASEAEIEAMKQEYMK
jgi:hypothetical protein